MVRRCNRVTLTAIAIGVFVHTAESLGNVDLEWRPVVQSVLDGQTVDMRLYAVSDDDTNQSIATISAILVWDPLNLELTGFIDNSPYDWGVTAFPPWSEQNDSWQDGDAYFIAWIGPGADPAWATPAPNGLLVATMQFVALQETPLTELGFLMQSGPFQTRIMDGLIPGRDVTGVLRPAVLSIIPCGHLGDMDVDCDVDLVDHAAFASCLTGPDVPTTAGCELADIDGDADVDLVDAINFTFAFTGSGRGAGVPPSRVTSIECAVLAEGLGSVTVAPGAEVTYDVLCSLTGSANEGLAAVTFDLHFEGGDLQQADVPTEDPMANFVRDLGLTNPAGYGGTAIGGDLTQVGGLQNAINNSKVNAPFPIGTVITGVGHEPVVLVTGTLAAPYLPGSYSLMLLNLAGSVIKEGEDGDPFWATEASAVGAIANLSITVEVNQGACCVAGTCAETNTMTECDNLGGVWYEGEDCTSFTCAICGNGMVEPGEECDPPGSTGCDSNCRWIPITGRIRFDHDNDPGTERSPLNEATVALSAGSFNLDEALDTRVTNPNGEFDFGTEHSGLDNLILMPCATNDIVQVRPADSESQPHCRYGFIGGGGHYHIELTGWRMCGSFSVLHYIGELNLRLQAVTQHAPPDISSGWKDWNSVRDGQQLMVVWTSDHTRADSFRSNVIYLDAGTAEVYPLNPESRWEPIAHEYGHFIHNRLGDGSYVGHRKTYSEGMAETFAYLYPYWFHAHSPIQDPEWLNQEEPNTNRQYTRGAKNGQGVCDIFLDMMDDVDSTDDDDQDGFAVDFRYVWNAWLQGEGRDIWDFWANWRRAEYDFTEEGDDRTWNQHVIDIYALHGLPITEGTASPDGAVLSAGDAVLTVPVGAVTEDTEVVGAQVSATSDSMLTDSHAFDGVAGHVVFAVPATLAITYEDVGVTPEEEMSLQIYYGNPDTSQWNAQVSTVDTAANTITTTISHLSQYAVGLPTLGTVPAAPTGLHVIDEVGSIGRVTIVWQANAEADLAGYALNVSASEVPATIDIFLTAEHTSYELSAVEPGDYTFTVHALDLDGNQSEASSIILAVIDDDADNLPDVWELQWLDGTTSGAEDDDDVDGADNLTEYRVAAFPNDADSDDDGMDDGWEIRFGFDP